MDEFTFCTLSYNQEAFIVCHLESIRNLIEKYGNGIKCNYVLADDYSTDRTVIIVERWINCNPTLFNNVDIISSNSNVGTVKNYCRAISRIATDSFKILAGDDLYADNNLFEVFSDADFYITPTIHFSDKGIESSYYNTFFSYLLSFQNCSDELREFIRRQYMYSTGIEAPGVFYKKGLYSDSVEKVLEGYKYIEDTPLFNWFITQNDTVVKTITKPYVFYRISNGISHNSSSPIQVQYEKERRQLNRDVHIRRGSLPKVFNPYQYVRFLDIKWSQLKGIIGNGYLNALKQFKMDYNCELERNSDFLYMINNKADSFYKEYQ